MDTSITSQMINESTEMTKNLICKEIIPAVIKTFWPIVVLFIIYETLRLIFKKKYKSTSTYKIINTILAILFIFSIIVILPNRLKYMIPQKSGQEEQKISETTDPFKKPEPEPYTGEDPFKKPEPEPYTGEDPFKKPE